jgi:hypothetical protein
LFAKQGTKEREMKRNSTKEEDTDDNVTFHNMVVEFSDMEEQNLIHDCRKRDIPWNTIFIPGITARARCLSSGVSTDSLDLDVELRQRQRGNRRMSMNRLSLRRDEIVPMAESLSFVSPAAAAADVAVVPWRDVRFSRMMTKLSAARRAADDARIQAIQLKHRWERLERTNRSIMDFRRDLCLTLEMYGIDDCV